MARYDLENRGSLCKYQYLHHCIRNDIQCGALEAGSRLPAKKVFARDLGVSVSTVEHAYSLLVSEGYLEAKLGSGFVVCAGKHEKDAVFDIDTLDQEEKERQNHLVDLRANRCSLELFPLDTWSRLMRQVLSERSLSMLETVPFNGLYALRRAIAFHLYESKGIRVSPDRIIVGAGTEYLYGKLLQLLGDQCIIAIEDPGYKKFGEVSRTYRTYWDYIPLDPDGISVEALMKSRADVVHVSPANHFPTGIIMSSDRRQELLSWANEKTGRFIIEDDYDSEIRYGGRAPAPLITQDHAQKVIYLNTFSKTLVPSLRIAYMILPETLMNLYRNQLSFYSCTVSSFEQSTLAKFISEGYFERHINRIRRHYKKQRQNILTALKQSKIAIISDVYGGEVGTHFILKVATLRSDEEVKQLAAKQGVNLAMLSDYCAIPSAKSAHCIVVNFASISSNRIFEAIALLEEIFHDEIQEADASHS